MPPSLTMAKTMSTIPSCLPALASEPAQGLDDLPRLLVAAPDVPGWGGGIGDLVVEGAEVDVPGLRRRPAGDRLDVLGVGGVAAGGHRVAVEVGGVDRRLPGQPGDPSECLLERPA